MHQPWHNDCVVNSFTAALSASILLKCTNSSRTFSHQTRLSVETLAQRDVRNLLAKHWADHHHRGHSANNDAKPKRFSPASCLFPAVAAGEQENH